MKVIDLKEVVNTKAIRIYTDFGIYDEFENESTEEFINEHGELVWDLYGEYDIEQLYVDAADTIGVDIK